MTACPLPLSTPVPPSPSVSRSLIDVANIAVAYLWNASSRKYKSREFYRICGAMAFVQLHMLIFLSLVGRTARKEKDSQGSGQEENYLYAAVRKCYNDWWEAQGEWPGHILLRAGLGTVDGGWEYNWWWTRR